jgi:tetratricopeptide (TPR) repeat protein/tRNA A-37 threonylcarbamoyl transferase component Bud32
MTSSTDCPSVEQLRCLLTGQVPEQEAEAVEVHLLNCDACLRAIKALVDEDPLAKAMRGLPPWVEAAAERAVERVAGADAPGETEAREGRMTTTGPPFVPDLGVNPLAPGGPLKLPSGKRAPSPELPRDSDRPALPGYEVLERLGHGGMGVVYKARQRALNRVVALKMILHAEHTTEDERRRFQTEAEAIARLQHPHIVQVHEVGEHRGLPYFSLELCPGGSLADTLDGTPWEAAAAAQLVETLAGAMHAAHRASVVHRDLKPANVLLTEEGAPKVADFGLAKCLDREGHTQTGAVMGTPEYMAPEQARGCKEVGPAADVYALGAILYQLLTGRPPFKAPTAADTLLQVVEDDPVPVRRLQPKVPRDLETVCLRCLRKDPARRYPTAADLAGDLGRFLRGEPVHARPTGPAERLVKWVRRRPAAAALVALCPLALAASTVAVAVLLHVARVKAEADLARRGQLHADIRALLSEGQAALAKGTPADLRLAQDCFRFAGEQAAAPLAPDVGELVLLRKQADQLLAEVVERIEKEQAKQRDEEERKEVLGRYRKVLRLRDEAFFLLHRDLVTGTDAASPEDSRRKALAALKELGLLDQSPVARWRLPSLERYSPDEEKELRAAVSEVVLLLAEATDRAGPGGSADALRVLDRGADLAPGHRVGLLRARLLERQGQPAEAARLRAEALRLAPQTGLEWFLAGRDRFVAGDWQGAIGDFDQALRLEPHLFWAQFLRALAWLQLGQSQSARYGLALCIREREGVGYVWCYLLHGLLAGEAGDYQAAEEDFRTAEGLAGGDVSALYVLHDHRALVALRRGEALQAVALAAWGSPLATTLWGLRREEARLAVEELRRAVDLRPELSPARINLARALADQQDLAGALAEVDAALRWRPDEAELYRQRAALHLRANDLAAARRDLGEAIRLGLAEGPSPALAKDYYECARLESRAGNYAAADRDCAAALDLDPGFAAALLLRGEVLLQRGRYREALAAWDRYLQVEAAPGPEVFLLRARARILLEDFANLPQEYHQRAVALRKDPSIQTALGWVYVVNESPKLALAAFEEALKLAPDHAEAYAGRGFVKALQGQYRDGVRDAEEGLRRARRRGPVPPRLLFNAARVYAQAAAAVLADPRAAAHAGEVRADYEDRAVELLAEALRAEKPANRKRFWAENIQNDGALKPVRGSRKFHDLEAEYQSAAR